MDEVKIWAIDDDSKAIQLESKAGMDAEKSFEDLLVKNPSLLMPGLTLIGRQTETGGGPLDLLGLDDAGRLIVFELKPGALYREAVAQVIDYASALDEKEPHDLARHIAASSGRHGIEKIENFEDWYKERFPGKGIETLKPLRMFLVGLGADAATERMVAFLAKSSGMDISLLTFHGFVYDGKTLLAKQVQVEGASDPKGSSPSRPNEHERLRLLEGRARELGAYDLLDAVRQMFVATWQQVVRRKPSDLYQDATTTRLNFYLWDQVKSGISYRVYFAIAPDVERRGIEVCFYPRAIDLSFDEFDQLDPEAVSFRRGSPWGQSTERVKEEILFPLNTYAEWEKHKEELTRLTSSVYEAWQKRDKQGEPLEA